MELLQDTLRSYLFLTVISSDSCFPWNDEIVKLKSKDSTLEGSMKLDQKMQ